MKKVVVGIISRVNLQSQKEYLLVSSKKDFGEYTGYYYPPGGHIKKGETKTEALKREIQEELGIEVEPLGEMAETFGDVKGQITYWWLCRITSDDLKINNKELMDARFFTKEEISNLKLWPATKRIFEKYIFKTNEN